MGAPDWVDVFPIEKGGFSIAIHAWEHSDPTDLHPKWWCQKVTPSWNNNPTGSRLYVLPFNEWYWVLDYSCVSLCEMVNWHFKISFFFIREFEVPWLYEKCPMSVLTEFLAFQPCGRILEVYTFPWSCKCLFPIPCSSNISDSFFNFYLKSNRFPFTLYC